MFQLGPFRLDLINDGKFELPSDAFIQSESRRLVGRARPRVTLGFNSLLVRGNDHIVLIDPGTGDKLLDKSYSDYRVEWPRKVFARLNELGVNRDDVDTVILTHLHWDHAAASTTFDDFGKVVPTFRNARYFLQRRELEAARASIAAGDNDDKAGRFEPLIAAGVLELLESDKEILQGISVKCVGGHCPGLQVVYIDGGSSGRAVYLSDLVPTKDQLSMNSILTYDENIQELMESKRAVLEEAADRHDLLLFVHSLRSRAGYITRTTAGEFEFTRMNL